jgi:hypothetical protein
MTFVTIGAAGNVSITDFTAILAARSAGKP